MKNYFSSLKLSSLNLEMIHKRVYGICGPSVMLTSAEYTDLV